MLILYSLMTLFKKKILDILALYFFPNAWIFFLINIKQNLKILKKNLDWREGLTIQERQLTQLKKLKELNDLIVMSKSNSEFVMANDLNHLQKFSKPKLGIKKNLKTLFTMAMTSNTASNSFTYIKGNGANAKFVKQLKK